MPRGGEGLASFKGSNPKHHDRTMQIRTASIGLLFGKGAATLRDVKELSGCVDIWIDQERANRLGLEMCDVVLRGEPKATSLAKRLIEEKLRSNTSKTIQIPTGRIGAILGKGAATIRELKAQSGCRIWIDQDRANSEGSELCDITLQGEPKAIALAQQLIEKKLGGNRTVQIPSECIGAILANIQELKERSGCHIWVGYERANREGSELCDVSLHGDPTTFALAQRLIKEKVGECYHFADSASDAGSSATSMSSMSIDSTGWSQEKSAEPPSAVAAWPALPGAKPTAATRGLPPISELERTKSVERMALIERQRREEEQRKLRAQAIEKQHSHDSEQHSAELVKTRSQLATENEQLKREKEQLKLARQYSQLVAKVFHDAENCWIGRPQGCDDATFASQLHAQVQNIAKENGGSGQLDWSLILHHNPTNRFHPSTKTLQALQDLKVDYLPVGTKKDAVDTKFKTKVDDFIGLEKHDPGKYLVILLACDKDYLSQIMNLQKYGFKTVVAYNGENSVSNIVRLQATKSGEMVDWSEVRAAAGGSHLDTELQPVPRRTPLAPAATAFKPPVRLEARPSTRSNDWGELRGGSAASTLNLRHEKTREPLATAINNGLGNYATVINKPSGGRYEEATTAPPAVATSARIFQGNYDPHHVPYVRADTFDKMRSQAEPGRGYVPRHRRNTVAKQKLLVEQQKKLEAEDMARQSSARLDCVEAELSAVQGELARERSTHSAHLSQPEPEPDVEPEPEPDTALAPALVPALEPEQPEQYKSWTYQEAVAVQKSLESAGVDPFAKLTGPHPEPEPQPQPQPETESASLTGWLSKLKLQQYESVLVEEGYDELQFLCDADADDVDELLEMLVKDKGMKKPHAKTFVKAWKKLSKAQ